MDKLEKAELQSMDVAADKRRQLAQLFPEVVTETRTEDGQLVHAVDFEKLKGVLGEFSEVLENQRERYGMTYPGKNECLKIIQQPSVATLKPCREESVNFDETENLFIEGDNLEVLKLLQKAYYGKVKMIYIDPPYNTGKEFIYPDDYSETLDTYLAYTGQVDKEGRKFSTNTEAEGRFHTKWLKMMYPRLYLARNLLTDDGVLFISIDDNEIKNLRTLCDELFGDQNYVECITWNKRIPKNDKGIGNIHEYILVYVKSTAYEHKFTMPKAGLQDINALLAKLKRQQVSIPDAETTLRQLYAKKGYDRGITLYNSLDENYEPWGKINLSWPNANTFGPRYNIEHPKTGKVVRVPDRGWRWKEDTFRSLLDYENTKELHDGTFMCGSIWFDRDESTQPSSIKYLKEVDTLLLRSILSTKSDGGVELERIFGGKNFYSYPKPTALIKILLRSVSTLSDKDIVLDFFCGSGTTADAVLQLAREEAKKLRFIAVELPEPLDQTLEACKAGFSTSSSIAKERIRRCLREEATPELLQAPSSTEADYGFRVFKLDRSNFRLWDGSQPGDAPEKIARQLELHEQHIDPNATPEDILYELLLKAGFPLTTKVEKVEMAGKEVFSISDGALLICLQDEITTELITAMADANPLQVICLDSGFKNNDQLKANAVQTFKVRNRGKDKESSIVFRTV